MARQKKADQAVQEHQAVQEPAVCPRCAGNKRVMDFLSGDRRAGESAGWKAVECPDCGGVGNVDAETVPVILAKVEQDKLR